MPGPACGHLFYIRALGRCSKSTRESRFLPKVKVIWHAKSKVKDVLEGSFIFMKYPYKSSRLGVELHHSDLEFTFKHVWTRKGRKRIGKRRCQEAQEGAA